MTHRNKGESMNQKFSDEIYEKLLEDPPLAKLYLSGYPEQKSKVKKIFPKDFIWWKNKKFNNIKKRYKPIEAIITEFNSKPNRLSHTKALIECEGMDLKHYVFIKNKNKSKRDKSNQYKHPALLKLNCKVMIAEKLGISIYSIKEYIAMLVRCGILRVTHLGNGKIYLSSGYWQFYPCEDKTTRYKVQPYMNEKIGKNLLDPDKAYLRKPKLKF